MSETLLASYPLAHYPLARYPARFHLVTPAIVERTVARRGMAGLLTSAERATFDKLPVERRQRDWFAGRIAAKRALRGACWNHGEPVPDYTMIEIGNDSSGAPGFTVRGRPELTDRFNISIAHTDGAAAAAVAETPASGTVGVDLEVTKPLSLALLRRVLRPAELDRLANVDTHPSPLVMWTAKEAALKAAHHICSALHDIELSWSGTRALGARVVGACLHERQILVRHSSVGPYTIALAFCR